jgi:hypothetical protein
MAHNHQASGSGSHARTTNLSTDEARILAENNILIPLAWHMPHGWHLSAGAYTVALIPPEGPTLDKLIERRWQMLPPA